MQPDFDGSTPDSKAIERLKHWEPAEGYYLAFSGGKDSVCLYDLAVRSGVRFDAHYNITNVDPPELVQFIKRKYPTVQRHQPERTMWKLIVNEGQPPTRKARFCCRFLKDRGGDGRTVLTGIRWEESLQRSERRMFEVKRGRKERVIPTAPTFCANIIIDWTAADVWQYIKQRELPYCKLYDDGFDRLGCVGCPNAGGEGQAYQFNRWPKLRAAYIRAFDAMLKERERRDKKTEWKTGEEVMSWWLKQTDPPAEGQACFSFDNSHGGLG